MVSDDVLSSLVLYDVTRLVNRRRAPHPTGIDRIDLKFAAATFAHFGAACLPVVQVGRRPAVLAAERELMIELIAGLDAAWFDDAEPNEAVAERIDHLGITGNRGYGARRAERAAAAGKSGGMRPASDLVRLFRRTARALRLAGRGIDGEGRPVLYVNASHEGVARYIGALDRLAPPGGFSVLAYIHDIMPLEVPQFSRADRIAGFATFLRELIAHRAAFVANSKATAAALAEYLEHEAPGVFSVPEVVYPGIEAPAAGLAPRRPIPPRANFVVLGTIEPRKNHEMLLEIWRGMVDEGIEPLPRLHIVGRRGWDIDHVAALLDDATPLAGQVDEASDCDDRAVRDRLVGATALLFPSFAEGFGLPLAEAAVLGVPVIAADLPVFREIVRDGVTLLPPGDATAWKAAILAAAADPGGLIPPRLSEELLDWPSQAALFTRLVEKALRGSPPERRDVMRDS